MNASVWVRGQLRTSVRYLAGVAGIGLFLGLAPAAIAAEGTPCVSDPQNITYGSLILCSIDPIGDSDTYNFSGTAGQTVSIQVTRQAGGTPQFCLYAPNGTLVSCTGYGSSAVGLTPTLDQTGTYVIRVNEYNNDATLPYNVTLGCLGGNCSNVCGDGPNCFESGTGATYMKVWVSGDGTLEEFQSPAGYQQLPVAADNKEGYALCSGTRVRGYDAGLDESGFGPATIIQPGGPGTFPLSVVRTTTDGVFQLTQAYTRDTGENDFTVAMTVKNLSAASVSAVKLARYFNGDIDNTGADDLYDRTLDTVWGPRAPPGTGCVSSPSPATHTRCVSRMRRLAIRREAAARSGAT